MKKVKFDTLGRTNTITGSRGRRSVSASFARRGKVPWSGGATVTNRFAGTLSGKTKGPLLSGKGRTRSYTTGNHQMTIQHTGHASVNMYKAAGVGVGALAAGYGVHKVYRHFHPKHPAQQVYVHHQPHMGVSQQHLFHQTHMGLGSAGF